jgi:hypothetical protein
MRWPMQKDMYCDTIVLGQCRSSLMTISFWKSLQDVMQLIGIYHGNKVNYINLFLLQIQLNISLQTTAFFNLLPETSCRNLLGQFIIWHALTNAEGYVLWHNCARSMSVITNENNDVTMFREVNWKMRLFAMKYSIEFEEESLVRRP